MADRNSSRLSSDWASYVHLHNQLEAAEPDPTVIVVKKAPPQAKRKDSVPPPSSDLLGSPGSTLDVRLRDAGAGDRRSAVTSTTSHTDDMSEFAEDDVVLSAATRVGLRPTASSAAPAAPPKADSTTDTGNKEYLTSHNKDAVGEPGSSTRSSIGESYPPSRTSIGEDSVNRHHSRISNGSGWQTPSEQQSPRSSRSIRPLTLPPAEPLPPLPSPSFTTPQLPSDGGAHDSPEISSQGLKHSTSSGRLAGPVPVVPPSPSSNTAAIPRSPRALGIEMRPSVSTSNVSRIRATMEAASSANNGPTSPRSPVPPSSKAQVSQKEREFMERIDRPAQSVTSSASTSSLATPAHRPMGNGPSKPNGSGSASNVTSPIAPSAPTMSTSSSAASQAVKPTPERTPNKSSIVAKVQAVLNAPTPSGSAAPASSSHNPLAGVRVAASEQVHGTRPPFSYTAPEGKGLIRRASSTNLQSRRSEMEEDKGIAKAAPQHRAVILKKAETRFAGAFTEVAQAFKQLQAEKKTLENIIRATTPLDGLGDQGQFSDYLKSMSAKVASSEEEIRKLLELLDQQRAVMDYMLETHEREADAHFEQIDEMQVQLDIVTEEAENHRANCVQLTADLDRAHNDAVAARADVLKLRAALQQESSKCEQAMTLLRAVQQQMKERDQANRAVREELESLRARQDDRTDARGRDVDMQAKLSSQHADELSSLSDELRRDLSAKHEADLLARSEQIRAELAAKHAEELEARLQQVRSELATQHKSDLKALKSEHNASLSLANAQAKEHITQATTAHETELKMLHNRLGKLERDGDTRSTLESELRELRSQQVKLGSQLAERTNAMNELEAKNRALESELAALRNAVAATAPPPVPGKDEDQSLAALQRQVQAAEARANAAERAKAELQAKLTSLEEGGSKSEIATLRAQLVDQRSREIQIRNAYKSVQYELRKVQQASKIDDRKRGFLTASSPSQGGLPPSPIDGGMVLQRSPSNSSQTNRQLKRLSLPLAAKGERTQAMSWMDIYQRDHGSRPGSASSTTFSSHLTGREGGNGGPPPSSFRPPLSAHANRNSFSTPSPPERRPSTTTTDDGMDDGRSSSNGTASHHTLSGGGGGGGGHGGHGGVLGYGSSSSGGAAAFIVGNGTHGYATSSSSSSVPPPAPSSSSSSTGGGGGGGGSYQHGGGRPLSDASSYSIHEEDEEFVDGEDVVHRPMS